jgi:hypothetical protein
MTVEGLAPAALAIVDIAFFEFFSAGVLLADGTWSLVTSWGSFLGCPMEV